MTITHATDATTAGPSASELSSEPLIAEGARRLDGIDLLIAIGGGAMITGVAATRGPLAACFGFAMAVGLVLCLRRPVLIGYAVVAIVPITPGFARGLPIPGLRVSEAVTVAAAALVLFRTAGRKDWRWQALDWAAFVFIALHVALGVYNSLTIAGFTGEGFQLMSGMVQFFLLYRVVRATIQTPAQRVVALRILLLASIPVSLLAVAQFVGVPGVQSFIERVTQSDVFTLWTYSVEPRATSVFTAWHPLAGYLFMVIVVCIAQLAVKQGVVLGRLLTVGILILSALGVVASQTLNVMAGVVVAACIIAVLTKRVFQLLVPLAVVGLVVLVLFGPVLAQRLANQDAQQPSGSGPGVPSSIDYRVQIWTTQYFPAIKKYWMTGYGPDLPPSIEWRSTESLYFTLLLRGGVLLLGSYFVLMYYSVRDCWRQRAGADPVRRAAALAIFSTFFPLVLMQAVNPYFTAGGLAQIWWVLLAFVAGASSASARQRFDQSADDRHVGART